MPLFAQVGALPPAFSPPCRVGAEEPRGGQGQALGLPFLLGRREESLLALPSSIHSSPNTRIS